MDICLYDPVLGYYSRNANQFGKAGDFYTSSDVHAVFGRLLARQFEELWQALDRPAAIESSNSVPVAASSPAMCSTGPEEIPRLLRGAERTRCRSPRPRCKPSCKKLCSDHIDSGKATIASVARTPIRARSEANAPIAQSIALCAPKLRSSSSPTNSSTLFPWKFSARKANFTWPSKTAA